MRSLVVAITIVVFGSMALTAQPKLAGFDAVCLHRAEKALTDVIVHDIFSPPVASRIYAYSNIAAYEVLAHSPGSKSVSLHGLINGLPKIPASQQHISYALASLYAFYLTGKKLVFSEEAFSDSMQIIFRKYRSDKKTAALYDASIRYGNQVADSIIKWAGHDKYSDTRKLRRYSQIKKEGKWIPTPPGYMAAVEPYWNQIRTMVIDSASQYQPGVATEFSKEAGSDFYKGAIEVYKAGQSLTQVQKEIAMFWDCNPFYLNVEGHLNFATKKISPGGHWMLITANVLHQQQADVFQSAAAYAFVSVAMFDAFISCWDEKYRSNVIRPETYINAYIDESWRPVLQTPPFPEYTSGHSMISSAVAKVLTHLYGNLPFDDNAEVEYGLPVRKFTSFQQASEEAAISRFYGGIHYMYSIKNGQVEGALIGERVVNELMKRAGF